MYNLSNIEVHNNYHFQMIDKEGGIVKEGTAYNEADAGLYVAMAGIYGLNSTVLTIFYNAQFLNEEGEPAYRDYESSVTKSISLTRQSDNIDYNVNIPYGGDVDFLASEFAGRITRFCLGTPYVSTKQEQSIDGQIITVTSSRYWSEASYNAIKDETQSLHINVTIYMSANPTGLNVYYDANISSILHKNSPFTLAPVPLRVGLSAINLSDFGNNNFKLTKRIPVLYYLSMDRISSPEDGTYTVCSPTTSSQKKDYTIIQSDKGNVGSLFSMVFEDIGAMNLNNTKSATFYIPAVILTMQKMNDLLRPYEDVENSEEKNFSFFCSVPRGCNFSTITINGASLNSGSITYNNPDNMNKMIPSGGNGEGVAMEENESPHPLDYYRSWRECSDGHNDSGEYYANCVLGGIWEPPIGKEVCPRYLYFNNPIDNIYVGKGGATVQVKIQGNNIWRTVGATNGHYSTTYFDYSNFSNIEGYRVVVNLPQEGSPFFVNDAEGLTVPGKSFDPNILCIGAGGSNGDFGKAGIVISLEGMRQLRQSLSNDQNHSAYNIGILVGSGNFYKSTNTIAYVSYKAIAGA